MSEFGEKTEKAQRISGVMLNQNKLASSHDRKKQIMA